MTSQPLQLKEAFGRDNLAKYIAHQWHTYNTQRRPKIDEWKELRNYIFATDTRSTTNNQLPWKNSTTLPKLCQIRDNLHSNYISAAFPNDQWLKWEGYSVDDSVKKKARAIEAYMGTKTRESNFRSLISQLLYDYIDYGNAFAGVTYENKFIIDENGQRVSVYSGPIAYRISPLDIVFNPLAASFEDSFKIIRSLQPRGNLYKMAQERPNDQYLQAAITNREKMIKYMQAYGLENVEKDEGMQVDGFGNYSEYLGHDYVEFLEFHGDLFNSDTNELQKGRKIVIVDRMWVIVNEPIKSWLGKPPIFHVGWRTRPDNLWSMGPLDNLVGLQYRIDHLENSKADAYDLGIHPPLLIQGEVEEFKWGPGEEIHIDENGNVTELARNVQWVLQANNDISILEQKMEQYAGAPREAMGIRTAGEKTAFEVEQLMTASGRIFQEKIVNFEINMLEPVLNSMLEHAKRNIDSLDYVKIFDDEIGVTEFMEITKEDITASGKLRPIGARHFAAQAQLVQNLTNLSNTQIWQQVSPHMSSKKMAQLIEEVLGLSRFSLFRPNVAVFEQQETAGLANQAQEDLQVAQATPLPPGL